MDFDLEMEAAAPPGVIIVSCYYKNHEQIMEEAMLRGEVSEINHFENLLYEESEFAVSVEILGEGGAPEVNGTNPPDARTNHIIGADARNHTEDASTS